MSRLEVEKRANDLLLKHHIDSAPIPVEKIAKGCHFKVIRRYFDDVDLSGTVIRNADGAIAIGINSLHSPVRQRFSIAHEIGHALMHLGEGEDLIVDPPARNFFNRDRLATLGEDSNEIEANQFAAALLMPADLVFREGRNVLATTSKDTVDLLAESLAGRFRVSTQAMRFRLVNLGVIEPD